MQVKRDDKILWPAFDFPPLLEVIVVLKIPIECKNLPILKTRLGAGIP